MPLVFVEIMFRLNHHVLFANTGMRLGGIFLLCAWVCWGLFETFQPEVYMMFQAWESYAFF